MDSLTPEQLNAMIGLSKMTPNQSATALGHSNSGLSSFLGGTPAKPFSDQEIAKLPGQVKEMVGAVGNDAVRFLQSAVQAPTDIISAAQGKSVNTQTLPNFTGEGQQTFQAEFQSKTLPDVISGKTSPIKATLGTVGNVLGGALNFLGVGLGGKAAAEATPAIAKTVANTTKGAYESMQTAKATDRLASTAETMTKAERKSAIAEGRLKPTTTGGGKFVASDTEKRAASILKGKLSTNPVKNVPVIQREISSRGQEVEDFLSKNAKPITNAEDYTMFQQKAIESEKYMTPTAQKAYQDQISVFQRVLKDFGDYNTSNYYKALKDFETNVTSNLPKGKEALLDEGGSARLQAAKDVRSIVRDMIGQKNPEFRGKMFDLASLYDTLDTTITKADKVDSFAKRHPYIVKGAKYGAAGAAAGLGLEGEKLITGQ